LIADKFFYTVGRGKAKAKKSPGEKQKEAADFVRGFAYNRARR
jgi:hypothetical protein